MASSGSASTDSDGAGSEDGGGSVGGLDGAARSGTHWVRWHQRYEDPDSALSTRLQLVQAGVRAALDRHPPGPLALVSMCAGQGRDVIDVVAGHGRRADVRALLVERDPFLVAFARKRAADAGVGEQIEVIEGDASSVRTYVGFLPADLVLICGVFGNICEEDIRGTVSRMPSFCATGGTVIWTRHRRSPDLTPSVREWFSQAGFEEMSFVAPAGAFLSVGCHRLPGGSASAGSASVSSSALDPNLRLFDFVGDGSLPA
jgi:hypothetical protein